MKYTLSALGIGLLLAGAAMTLPDSALAARTIITNRANEVQYMETISPADPDAVELLELLGITLAPTDETWNDDNFVAMINKYKAIKSNLVNLIIEGGDLALEAFDMIDFASKINNEQFSQFALTEADRAEMEAFRAELEMNLDLIKANPEQLFELLDTMLNEGSLSDSFPFEDPTYSDDQPYAYGYSDPYETVNPGQLIWLYDDSYNPLDNDLTVTWSQYDGPEVTWIKTTCETCRAFIAPSLDGYDYDYITFELTVDNGVSSDTNYVYVYINRPLQGVVADLFREVYDQEPDQLTVDYWESVLERDFTLEQIREHFVLMRNQRTA